MWLKLKWRRINPQRLICLTRYVCRVFPSRGTPVASERLMSCFTSARHGLEERQTGEKKGYKCRNTLMQIHTVKLICLVFKTTSSPPLQWAITVGPRLSMKWNILYGRDISQPSSSNEQVGSKFWTECGDDETPAGFHPSAACQPTAGFSVRYIVSEKTFFILCVITAGFSAKPMWNT